MSEAMVRFAKALDFAARKHVHQRRKGAAAEPYINHLSEVTRLLAEATGGRDTELVLCGLLHDAIEDTDATVEELTAEFGPEVANVVAEVSDDKSLPKAERKRLQVERAAAKSARARMVKLADKTSNLRALIDSPPADWDLARKREYFAWARAVADGCRGVNPDLERGFDDAWHRGMRALDAAAEA